MATDPRPDPGNAPLTPDEIARRADEIYERSIRARVEKDHDGEFLVMNVETGEYELDRDDVRATERAISRFGKAPLFTMRVGRKAEYRIGGYRRAGRQC